MNAPAQTAVLRPLGVGEILDRAVNLCVRNFGVLALINVVFIVPAAFIQFQSSKDLNTLVQALLAASKSANGNSQAILNQLSNRPQPSGWVFVGYFVILLLSPLTSAALVEATSKAYLGRAATFGESYGVGLKRWLPIVGVALLYLFAGGAVYFVVLLAVVAVAFAIGLLSALSSYAAIAIGVVLGLLFLAALIFAVTIVVLAWQVTIVCVVVENLNFAQAFVRGLARVLTRSILKRTLLAGFAFLAVMVGITLIDALGEGVIVGLLRNPYVGVAFASVVRIVSAAFTTAFVVIFYYDLRVREEGLDLTMLP